VGLRIFKLSNPANLLPNTQDLFDRQKETWGKCPPGIQEMILKNIRETINKRVEQVHGVQRDRREGYDDDWEAVSAELESRISNPASAQPLMQHPNPRNMAPVAHQERRNPSPETDNWFDLSQTSVARELRVQDSDPLSPDDTEDPTVGPTADSGMSHSQSRGVSLSLGDDRGDIGNFTKGD
jgi:hypothetical protein